MTLPNNDNVLYATRFSEHNPADYWPILSFQEQTLAAKKMNPPLKAHAILSYGLRRTILARLLHQSRETLTFTTIAQQKPVLADNALFFNVSHSDDYWVMLVNATTAVGVDVELTTRKTDALNLAERFFSTTEVAQLKACAEGDNLFWRLWTAKEALLKASGEGILNGLAHAELWMNEDGHLEPHTEAFKNWQIETINIFSDVMISVAIPRGTHLRVSSL